MHLRISVELGYELMLRDYCLDPSLTSLSGVGHGVRRTTAYLERVPPKSVARTSSPTYFIAPSSVLILHCCRMQVTSLLAML